MDEHVAVVRLLRARVRRRYAEATVRAIEAVDSARERLRAEQRAGAVLVAEWRRKARRLIDR